VIDDSLPPEEEGNYVDCNTPEAIADNKTRCCQVEDSKGCCTNETKCVERGHALLASILPL